LIEVLKQAEVEWRDGAPWSILFGDIYFSPGCGWEAASTVFIEPNSLAERFVRTEKDFVIAETGFGTGLNFFATLGCWREKRAPGSRLTFISTELHPLSADVIRQACKAEGVKERDLERFLSSYPPPVKGSYRIEFEELNLSLVLLWGDALESLKQIEIEVDAWFLDGFAPRCNKNLWSEELFNQIATLSSREATFATFSAAGEVRRGLEQTGFEVERIKGYKNKKHASKGIFRAKSPQVRNLARPETAMVIGAGIAGCSVADCLAEKGIEVTVLEEKSSVAEGATGNPRAIAVPYLGNKATTLSQFYHLGFYELLETLRGFEAEVDFRQCGAIQLESCYRLKKLAKEFGSHRFPEELVRKISVDESSELAGIELSEGGFFLPQAGHLDPRSLCSALIGRSKAKTITGSRVEKLVRDSGNWIALGADAVELARTEICVIANAWKAEELSQSSFLPLEAVRGQCLWMENCSPLQKIVCFDGYITPAFQSESFVGATYSHDDYEEAAREEDSEEMLSALSRLGLFNTRLVPQSRTEMIKGERVEFRTSTYDRAPYVGKLPKEEGLYISVGFGSRGISTAGLAARMLVEEILGVSLAVQKDLVSQLAPARYLTSRAFKNQKISGI